ncbi:thiol-disulfide oxidoreductase DCC family protein [Roseateles sp. LKC17W]|uniref:Thiol-disulfide oxidoreductase DCC family protein n=1 Tax=Pelomonas margarita TaxID=3299031 RepID=A0ABW7FN16_9BURK
MTSPSTTDKPTVYFDGACPVCRREIAVYQRGAGADALCWVDASDCPDDAFGPELARDAALARLHLRQPDGRLVHGAAAFLAMWTALPQHPGLAGLARLLDRPPLVRLLDLAYGAFLRLRRLWRPAV